MSAHLPRRTTAHWAAVVAAVLAVAAALLSAGAAPARAAANCDMTPENFAYRIDRIATPTQAGYVAGDGFNSVRLDAHTVLITVADTWFGTAQNSQFIGGTMKRNTLLVYDDRLPGCFRSIGGTDPAGVFPAGAAPDQVWNWPGSPTQANGVVAIPMEVMTTANNPAAGVWNFAQLRTEVQTFRWDGANLKKLSARTIGPTTAEPAGRQLMFFSAKVIGDHTYLTVADLRPGQTGHDVYLARVPVRDWFAQTAAPLSTLEFLTSGSTWVRGASYGSLKRIVDGSGDASVTIEHTGREMHLIYKQYSIFGNTIMDAHAPTPEGVWTHTPVAPAPTKPGTWSYHAVVHEAWTVNPQSLNRKLTVNFGGSEDIGWEFLKYMWRYRPELRDVTLPEKVRVKTGQPGGTTVVGNLTPIGTFYPGHVRAYPCDQPAPGISTNNFRAGQAAPNFVAVKTDAAGDFCVDSPAPAHFLFDLYGAASGSVGVPGRLLDTRAAPGVKPAAGTSTRVHTPAPPGAYALGNLTVTGPEGAGHTRAYPCDQPLPLMSVNNYTTGQTIPNFAATRTDANGDVCLYTSNSAHLVYDYVGSAPAGAGAEQAARLIDTRSTATPPAGAVTRVHAPAPPGSTVTGNLTVVSPRGAGHSRVWNCDQPMPGTSANNYTANETRPNFVAVKTDGNGDFCVYNSQTADILFDYAGSASGMVAATPRRLVDTR